MLVLLVVLSAISCCLMAVCAYALSFVITRMDGAYNAGTIRFVAKASPFLVFALVGLLAVLVINMMSNPPTQDSAALQPGTVVDGYLFTGGHPGSRENWVEVDQSPD